MKRLFFRTVTAALCFGSVYLTSGQSARADEWGCQVILCLSNPGGPTQFAACRPPIHKLWKWLAKGRSFPTCSGVGFQSSRPQYDPFYCGEGYRLIAGQGQFGRHATCVSVSRQVVDDRQCGRDHTSERGGYPSSFSARWKWKDGHQYCTAYSTSSPLIREKPRYIEVIIEGAGKQRVWF
ncbi:hypothetical protein [Shinella oryzae]|uniref:Uncharacterized protein n=1 Tax=Shinella oryzae TaxID=2871820 RepID=A0ABY9K8P1_9HYPH|nr:hypothetical protein [Shinella oryzae]WLS04925.1 hypothetical protein Q9315_22335 [Shinella oryzae]